MLSTDKRAVSMKLQSEAAAALALHVGAKMAKWSYWDSFLFFMYHDMILQRAYNLQSRWMHQSSFLQVSLIQIQPHTMKLQCRLGRGGPILWGWRPAARSMFGQCGISTRIETITGLAEVLPEDKERIVRTLQSRGHIIGDGTNDDSALNIANCGIVAKLSTTTRSTVDMIQLSHGGLAPLIQAMQISRQTFEQSYSYLVYETAVLLPCLGLWSM